MKNPFMSMWLSAANKAAGMGRAYWSAEARRQQTAFVKGLTKGFGATPTKRATPTRRRK